MTLSRLPRAHPTATLISALLFLLAGCGESGDGHKVTQLEGRVFGTFYRISLAGELSQTRQEAIHDRVRQRLDTVDRQMSTWRDDSDLNRLNNAAPGEWVGLPEPLTNLLARSRTIASATGGAFDITVGGLVNLWSFGPEARPAEKPSQEELRARLAQVGYDKVEVDTASDRARRLTAASVDLSAIAKGHAVDLLGALLEQEGYPDHLVNIGGDLLASGRKPSGEPWQIGIEVPRDGRQSARHIVPLSNLSLATSGDYRNYFEQDGRRYSHTIDPRDGRPVQHRLASVSVFHPQNTMADALATAFMVMGMERALAYAREHDIAALLIERHGERFRTRLSPALESILDDGVLERLLND